VLVNFNTVRRTTVRCLIATVDKGQIPYTDFAITGRMNDESGALKMLIRKWSHGRDNNMNRYCSYSGNIVILKEIGFWSCNRVLF